MLRLLDFFCLFLLFFFLFNFRFNHLGFWIFFLLFDKLSHIESLGDAFAIATQEELHSSFTHDYNLFHFLYALDLVSHQHPTLVLQEIPNAPCEKCIGHLGVHCAQGVI